MRIDGLESNLDTKRSVRVATTAPITLSGLQTIDGVSLAVNDRVLVKNQTDAKTNGIYAAQTDVWLRTYDAFSTRSITSGLTVNVDEGSQADTQWSLTTNNPVLGVSDLLFRKVVDIGQLDILSANFSSHAANHSPNGSDPIPTAPAITITGTSFNGIGTSNYLARSDHSHALGGDVWTNTAHPTTVAGYGISDFTATVRNSLSIGGDLSYNSASGQFSYTTPTSDGITEGTTNLYYAHSRARAALSASGQITYSAASGVIGWTAPTQSFTGDATGSGTIGSSISLTLANSGVTAGTFSNVNVNSKGLVTGGIGIANTLGQIFAGNVNATSFTNTLIPYDNTTPLSTEGTQIMSQAITPRSAGSDILISFSGMVEVSNNNRTVTFAIFRGTTCIGSTTQQFSSANVPEWFAFSIVDSPATTSATTYTIRIGTNSNTTLYFGRGSAGTMGGINKNAWVIMELV